LAALVSLIPLGVVLGAGPAGADPVADCDATFSAPVDANLSYTTDPADRYARIGQTVRLSAGWDPAAWDNVTSAVACVRVNDAVDAALGGLEPRPANGAYDHAFAIPDDVPEGTRLCTRIRLAGDPAGEATEAVSVSRTHCFEVDTAPDEELPPDSPPVPTPPSAEPAPVAPPANTSAATGSPVDAPVSPEGGASAAGTPFNPPEATPAVAPFPPAGATASAPMYIPLLPETGSLASNGLLHAGEWSVSTGLALLVLFGRRRRVA
jgi:hypothetical protein